MSNQNYVHVRVPCALGLPIAGELAVIIPPEGIPAELLPVLAQYTGLNTHTSQRRLHHLQLNCAPTWENVILAAQKAAAELAAELVAKAERLAKEEQKRAEDDEVWIKEKTENEERARIDAEKAKAEKLAYVAALTEFVTKNMPESLDRFHAHVLPLNEVVAIWIKQITPEIQAKVYTKRAPADVITCDCHNGSDDDENAVKSWERKKLDILPPMTAAQFLLWKEFKKLEDPAKGVFVQVDEHEARLSCRCNDPSWYSIRVTVTDPILNFTAHFDYEF